MLTEMLMVLIDNKKTIRGYRVRPLSFVWFLLTFKDFLEIILVAFTALSVIYGFCFLV